jgi:hypothetical protein
LINCYKIAALSNLYDMKFIFKTLIITFLCNGIIFLTPWWWGIAIPPFLVGVFGGKAFASFWEGFFGAGLLWFLYALYRDRITNSILSSKVAPILFLEDPLQLLLFTGTVAGIVGGLSSLSGNYLHKLFVPKPDDNVLRRR